MDTLTFISRIVASLAWPLIVLIAVIILRPMLLQLIPLLQRLKYKDLEVDFGKQVEQARAELAHERGPERERAIGPSPIEERLIKLADISPRAAVLEAWRRLESALVKQARARIGPADKAVSNPREAIRILRGHQTIPPSTAAALEDLRGLRNQAAHAPDFVLTPSSAIEYANLAYMLEKELEERGGMETIELVDAKTGQLLHIEFDLDADRMTIDGVEVERKRPLEANEDEFVYAPLGPGPWKLFHLTAEQAGRMRALWESRRHR